MSHTQLELYEDMPAERGYAEAGMGLNDSAPLLPNVHACVCPVCAGTAELMHPGVCRICAHSWAQTASDRCCTLVCAVTPVALVSLCILGSVCCMTTLGQIFCLDNGSFCPCPSHVDVSVGIHTAAMHMCNTHALNSSCQVHLRLFGVE